MKTYQHKTLWLVFYFGGGVSRCKTREAAQELALNDVGVFGIRSPIYC